MSEEATTEEVTPEVEEDINEEAATADVDDVRVFIRIKGGEVVSILSNCSDLDIDVIDEDIEEISQEISELNQEINAKLLDTENNYEVYEYVLSALQEESE